MRFNKHSKRTTEHAPDFTLIAIVGVILTFGIIMLSSASAVVSYIKYGDAYHYLKHQLFPLTFGLFVFWFVSRIDYHLWRKYAFWFLLISIVFLLLVFVPGLSANYGKARSWIKIFGFSLQPSEFVKLSVLLYLAAWLEGMGSRVKGATRGFGPFLIILGIIASLMLMQPDLGTLSIVAITSLIVYFIGGGRLRHITLIALFGIFALSAMVQLRPYQMNRFKCLLNPDFSKNDICYQVNQSLIAIGSGGFWGRGLGESRQKYMYLPEVSGDSIFAIIGEEVGFVFSSFLVVCFLLLFWRGYLVAKYAPDEFGRILAIGIVSWLVMQAIINISGMINIMPMTGVPLPFVSYGGSAMLSALAAVGILVNISKQTI